MSVPPPPPSRVSRARRTRLDGVDGRVAGEHGHRRDGADAESTEGTVDLAQRAAEEQVVDAAGGVDDHRDVRDRAAHAGHARSAASRHCRRDRPGVGVVGAAVGPADRAAYGARRAAAPRRSRLEDLAGPTACASPGAVAARVDVLRCSRSRPGAGSRGRPQGPTSPTSASGGSSWSAAYAVAAAAAAGRPAGAPPADGRHPWAEAPSGSADKSGEVLLRGPATGEVRARSTGLAGTAAAPGRGQRCATTVASAALRPGWAVAWSTPRSRARLAWSSSRCQVRCASWPADLGGRRRSASRG